MPAMSSIAMHFFLQLAVILLTFRLLWPVFRRLGQVQVVAIMLAGFALGPSLLGAIAPQVQTWLFPQKLSIGGADVTHPSLVGLYVAGQLGLVLYMFLVGMSFETGIVTRHVQQAAVTSVAGIATPMLLGGLAGWLLFRHGGFFSAQTSGLQAALFVAAAISITAFPTLAWIIYESGLVRTRLGTIALAAAAVDDAAAWILLAAVVASTKNSSLATVVALVGGTAYVVVMLTVGRRLLRRLGAWVQAGSARTREPAAAQGSTGSQTVPAGALMAAVLVMLIGAWFTDLVGVHAVFGAFIAGTAMPRGAFTDQMRRSIEPLTAYVLLPMFFVYSGLNTHLTILFDLPLLGVLVLVLVVAFVGKGVSVAVAARLQGMDWYEATSLGALMNARGLMELVLLNIGVSAGIVTPQLYTILALMAIITTVAATPLHSWIQRRRPAPRVAGHSRPPHEPAPVLVAEARS